MPTSANFEAPFIRVMFKTRIALMLFFLTIKGASFAQNWDIQLLREIHMERNTGLDQSNKLFSNSVTPMVIGTPIAIFSLGLIRNDLSLEQKGFFLAQSIIGSTILSAGLKYSINRVRPYVTYPDLQPIYKSNSPSFPSGHTTKAFALATSLSIAYPEWYVVAPSILWASAVGYSRLHLGLHYPSDVLAGAVLGSASAFLTYKLNKVLNKKIDKQWLFQRAETL
jgi:membrane-associated phospholipid phosphatase